MQRLPLILTIGAYASLSYLAWSLAKLSRCGSSEGCLGYALHFWMGAALASLTLVVGTAFWLIMRPRMALGSGLPLTLALLLLSLFGLALYLTLGK